MSRYLPSPIALRSFEAAARHLSFTRAANELNVTQAAISHQVKSLEDHLRVRLFVRLTRKLLLTNDGQALYSVVTEAFDRIGDVADKLRSGTGNQTLTVSLTPYFSAKWLSHRLSRFWSQYPNIDLQLHHSRQPVQLDQAEVDMAISWGRDEWPNLAATVLLRSRVIPVCSPMLMKGKPPLCSPADLNNHTLLHDGDYELWTQWLQAVGVEGVNVRHGSTMDDPNVVLQAAIDGQGIALGADALLGEELSSGRLVMPFDPSISTDLSYYAIYPTTALERPKVKAFYEWLLAEAECSETYATASRG